MVNKCTPLTFLVVELRESSSSSGANTCHLHHVTHESFITAQAAVVSAPPQQEPEDTNKETKMRKRKRFPLLKPQSRSELDELQGNRKSV